MKEKIVYEEAIPHTEQEALNLLSLFYMPLYTFIHNLLNVLVQIANKMELKKVRSKKTILGWLKLIFVLNLSSMGTDTVEGDTVTYRCYG
jgi:hypothetical protein